MELAIRGLIREIIVRLLFFMPTDRRIRVERWLRGREEFRKLGLADAVIVSFGKSGRTWLRVMLSRVFQLKYDLSDRHLIAFDNLHRKNKAIPKIHFTHDNYLKDYVDTGDDKTAYVDKRVVLMVRHPADTAVSQYFQWKHRMRPSKRLINRYPDGTAEMELYDFVLNPGVGLPKIIGFMNGWARALPRFRSVLIVRYEDMRADPEAWLAKIADFLGTPATIDHIKGAVEFASIDSMRQMEQKRVFWLAGRRMLAKDRNNLDTYKVRRAKVGGYRGDFSPDQVAAIDDMIDQDLSPIFGYHRQPAMAEVHHG